MDKPQDLLREFSQVNGKRTGEGVTPLEYLRWSDLRSFLDALCGVDGDAAGAEALSA